MSLKQTTAAAQALYEGVDAGAEGKIALVTYIRTDSTRVSPDAAREAKDYIIKMFGDGFAPEKPNFFASKKGAQDAHEAIRPISLERAPDSLQNVLTKQNYRLYKLIYERFLASQMSEAQYNSLAVEITSGRFAFKLNGKTPLFPGYTAVYQPHEDNKGDDGEDMNSKLPDLAEGERLNFIEYKFEQKFTKPPARYTEASLVKAMEEKGIGRPATYTPTITILTSREYVVKRDPDGKDSKFLFPTALGEKVTDMLVKYFPDIIDVAFTAQMEEKLDTIEDGGIVWQNVVGAFYDGFEDKISKALGDGFSLKAADVKTDILCDKCGAEMVIKNGRFGQFLACSAFPKCRNTKQIAESAAQGHVNGDFLPDENKNALSGAVSETADASKAAPVCDKCGKPMTLRNGKFGQFWGCSGYPACKNLINIQKEDAVLAGVCPECGKPMRKITTRKGPFWGCSGYPVCNFSAQGPVSEAKCPVCGGYLYQKDYRDGTYRICGSKTCDYRLKIADKPDTDAEKK
jgi:DNA topoisomerase-1